MKDVTILKINNRHFWILLLLGSAVGRAQTIDHIQPDHAAIGATVFIAATGTSGPPLQSNTIWFTNPAGGFVQGNTVGTTDADFGAIVPEKAGAGPMYFKDQNGNASNTVMFTPTNPVFISSDPDQGIAPGGTLKIYGQFLNPTVGGNGNKVTVFNTTINNATFFRKPGQPVGNEIDELTLTVPTLTGLPRQSSIQIVLPNGTSVEGGNLVMANPPEIVNNSPQTSVVYNTNLAVSVTMTSSQALTPTGALFFRSISAGSSAGFTQADMTFSGNTFTGSIPKSGIGELGIEYKIKVADDFGLINTDTATLYTVAVNYADGMDISSYPSSAAGHDATNYRIISIPLELTHTTVNGIFSNELGSYDPSVYRLFKYDGDGNDHTFAELDGTSSLMPGKGYWFISAQSKALNTGAGITVPVTTGGPFMMELHAGWNLIGNPYNFNISWVDVIAANPQVTDLDQGNSGSIRVYRGEPSNVDILHAMEGGFVRYTGGGPISIQIPVKKNAAIAGGRTLANTRLTNSLEKPSWEISFDLVAGKTHDPFGGIGMRPDASEGFDKYDDYASPRFFDYLEVKFPKSYAGMTVSKDVVPTAENFVWKFEVASNVDENTTIQWDNSYFGDSKEIYLLDVETFRVVDMRKESQYHFSRNVSRHFKVVFGDATFAKNELIPDKVTFSEPYPNPFSDRVAVDFALPASNLTEGVIEIFDAMGARVASVSTGAVPGPSHWEWQAESQAPGFYFVRVRLGTETVTRKIVKKP